MGIAAAIAGAAVIGGVATAVSGTKAANAQKDAAAQSVAEQQRQYNQTRDDYAPWRTAGQGALSKLSSLYGISSGGPATAPASSIYDEFRATPGYQFTQDEGTKAAERSASARGLLGSGAALKAVDRFSAGLADQTYNNYVGQLQSIAGLGQSATGSTAQAGQNASNNISQAYLQAGNARASSYANIGSAINGTVNNLAGAYAYGQGSKGVTSTKAGDSYSSYNLGFT